MLSLLFMRISIIAQSSYFIMRMLKSFARYAKNVKADVWFYCQQLWEGYFDLNNILMMKICWVAWVRKTIGY